MRMATRKLGAAIVVTLLGLLGTGQRTHAQSGFTITDVNNFRDTKGPNALGIRAGDVIQFGAQVSPNGFAGTMITASQGSVQFTTRCSGFTVNPNFCSTTVPFNAALTGPWTLTFTNGPLQATVTTPPLSDAAAAAPAPFAPSVTVSGSGTTPTFGWQVPSGFTVNLIEIDVFDKTQSTPNGVRDIIFAIQLSADTTSFTMPATFGTPPRSLVPGTPYAVELQFIETRDGSPNSGSPHSNVSRRAVSFTEFTLQSAGTAAITVGFTAPLGSSSVNVAGTYGANGEVTIDTCTTDLGCSGGPARFEINPGQAVDTTGLHDLLLTANAPGTLTLNFSATFPDVASSGQYARSTRVDGQFFPATDAPFGGISHLAQANGDVINQIAPGPGDVGPSLRFPAAPTSGAVAFSDFVTEQNIACNGTGDLCTPTVVSSTTLTFNAAGDQIFIPGSIVVLAARVPGPTGVQAIQTGLTFAAQVLSPISPDGSSLFTTNSGALPVLFNLFQNGTPTCQLPAATISVFRTAPSPGPVPQSAYILPSDTDSLFRIDAPDCLYGYDFNTRLAPGTYRVAISINGVPVGSAMFCLADASP